ncbi:MAG: Rubrerythrin [Thermoplasmata archaeon]|nr:MAG: Rubrerythrin [Thermoplasmata archaeon]
MDLEKILKVAIKAEIEAAENYRKMREITNIFFLKDKLQFLENEEKAHRNLLEKLFKKKFPDKEIILPEKSEIPFPKFEIRDDMQLSEIIRKAMEAEKMAAEFYREMEGKLEIKEEKAIIKYLMNMEESHYHLLESELELAYNFELYDEIHEMMHVGP